MLEGILGVSEASASGVKFDTSISPSVSTKLHQDGQLGLQHDAFECRDVFTRLRKLRENAVLVEERFDHLTRRYPSTHIPKLLHCNVGISATQGS